MSFLSAVYGKHFILSHLDLIIKKSWFTLVWFKGKFSPEFKGTKMSCKCSAVEDAGFWRCSSKKLDRLRNSEVSGVSVNWQLLLQVMT